MYEISEFRGGKENVSEEGWDSPTLGFDLLISLNSFLNCLFSSPFLLLSEELVRGNGLLPAQLHVCVTHIPRAMSVMTVLLPPVSVDGASTSKQEAFHPLRIRSPQMTMNNLLTSPLTHFLGPVLYLLCF